MRRHTLEGRSELISCIENGNYAKAARIAAGESAPASPARRGRCRNPEAWVGLRSGEGAQLQRPPAIQTPPRAIHVPWAPEPSSWAGPGAQGILGAAQRVLRALP